MYVLHFLGLEVSRFALIVYDLKRVFLKTILYVLILTVQVRSPAFVFPNLVGRAVVSWSSRQTSLGDPERGWNNKKLITTQDGIKDFSKRLGH